MATDDPRDLVRRGYDVVSTRYEEAYHAETKYRPLSDELLRRLPAASAVLDLSCGSGVPLARALAAVGHRVTGVDFSAVQVHRARENVPAAAFVEADVTGLDVAVASVDAVVCLYALIHIPVTEQPPLLGRIAGWLRPGGLFVASTGHRAFTGVEEDWLGGGVPMWWSQADTATNRGWIERAGLVVDREEFLPEGDGGHTLFWAHRPPALDPVGPADPVTAGS